MGGKKETCISCGKCNQACPMGLDVKEMLNQKDSCFSTECIQSGACVDVCSKGALKYQIREGMK